MCGKLQRMGLIIWRKTNKMRRTKHISVMSANRRHAVCAGRCCASRRFAPACAATGASRRAMRAVSETAPCSGLPLPLGSARPAQNTVSDANPRTPVFQNFFPLRGKKTLKTSASGCAETRPLGLMQEIENLLVISHCIFYTSQPNML